MLVKQSSKVLLVLALAACGCESKKTDSTAPTPASNAAAPGATPETATKSTSAPAAEKKSYPSPEKFDIAPLAVGQWIRMLVKTVGQPPAQTFIRIVGKEGDSFWYEIESNTPNGTTVIQLLMDDVTKGNFSKGSIKKIKMKVGLAPVQEFSGPAMAAVSAMTDNYVAMFGRPNLDKAERGDASVNAGEFKGCYIHEIDQSVMGMSMKVKSWNHPAVPINGFVRSEGLANNAKTTTELYEMHMDGAKSVLQ
ncbi:MAG TPA: hypothetical protein PK156_16765 [Polyangium sp.]|nr:hypothetical protein [Polyangium sp.]